MPTSKELLFILIIAGAVVLVVWTIKDLVKKGEKQDKEKEDKAIQPKSDASLQTLFCLCSCRPTSALFSSWSALRRRILSAV